MKDMIRESIRRHQRLIEAFDRDQTENLIRAADLLIECLQKDGCIYLCGNGGSAADAQHIAGELVGRFLRNRRALAAVALSTDTSVMTAVANDFSYEELFERQVEALVRSSDVLWALSTSGTSANILAAVRKAKQQEARILAFTGRKTSPLEEVADVTIAVDAETSAGAQEVHQLAYHILCDMVERKFI